MNTKQISILSLCLMALVCLAGVPLSLSVLHSRMQTALCANNLRSCTQAWSIYASEFDGKHMAWWADTSDFRTQIPYTMWYYIKGVSLPGAAYGHDLSLGTSGWYNPETKSYGGFDLQGQTAADNPQYHCPKIAKELSRPFSPYQTMYRTVASYAYSLPDFGRLIDGTVHWHNDSREFYPEPDLFTHPSTTSLVQDITRISQYASEPNIWGGSGQVPLGIHNGKDNFAFADGHVELLAKEQVTEEMFRLYYTIDN